MRIHSFLTVLTVLLFPQAAWAEEDPSIRPIAREVKQLFKPEAFETLVNPNCSHCGRRMTTTRYKASALSVAG